MEAVKEAVVILSHTHKCQQNAHVAYMHVLLAPFIYNFFFNIITHQILPCVFQVLFTHHTLIFTLTKCHT